MPPSFMGGAAGAFFSASSPSGACVVMNSEEIEAALSRALRVTLVGSTMPAPNISTHSPFLLAMRGAKIYDMSENPVDVKRWTQLESVRTYYDFFKKHKGEF